MAKCFQPRHRNAPGRTFDAARDRDQALHKTDKWKRFSQDFLKENPDCYVCGKASQVTDHIEPSKGREEIFTRDGNFLALCVPCHNSLTRRFDTKFRPGIDTPQAKIEWMNRARDANQVLQARTFAKPKWVNYPT